MPEPDTDVAALARQYQDRADEDAHRAAQAEVAASMAGRAASMDYPPIVPGHEGNYAHPPWARKPEDTSWLLTAFVDSDGGEGFLHFYLRSLLLDLPDGVAADELGPELADLCRRVLAHAGREAVTYACLAYSLCPLHKRDYAICFDEETVECSQIRLIHPSHTT